MTGSTRILPEQRRGALRRLLGAGKSVRALECHSPLSAILASQARGASGEGFDALWASGFANATTLGLPDAELSLLERRLDGIADIASLTTLPIIADADTGGDTLAFASLCLRLEALGVSGIVVEDKAGSKRTSLAEGAAHAMENPHRFIEKIARARQAMLSSDVMIFARIESLIAGIGLDDALSRAEIYLRGAPDGVVIHSKDKTGVEIFEFMDRYKALQSRLGIRKPLVLIPTAYPQYYGKDLCDRGASVIIHGNHMIRAAFRAMQQAASSILDHDRALEAEGFTAPVKDLLAVVGTDENALPSRAS